MGEIYKGLTIRLGADASGLKKALRASDSAINATQKQLRDLAKAAKLDPASTKVFAEKMDVLGDKARSLSAKLAELKKSDFMQHLAVSTQDAALKAQYATREYANLCAQIKALKNGIAIDAGIDPFKKGQDPFKQIAEGSAAAVREIQRLGKAAGKTQAEVNKEVRQYLDLVRRWKMADTSNEIAKERAELDKFKTTLAATETEVRAVYAEMARLASANPKITQTVKFESFRREMERAEQSAKELRAEMSALDRALELDPHSIDAARLKFAAMHEQVRLNVAMIEQMETQLNTMRAKGLHDVAGKYVDLRQEIAKAEHEVEKWGAKLGVATNRLNELDADTSVARTSKEFKAATAEVAKFEKKLASAKNRLDRLAGAREYVTLQSNMAAVRAEAVGMVKALREAGDTAGVSRASLQQLGWALYSTLTPAFMMFGHAAIQAAEDVDAAYRNMRKTVAGSEEQFEGLKQAAIDYSRTHVTDAATLLEIEAMGGQLGVATKKLEGFATTVSNLEIATNLDADTASQQLGQLSAILNDMTQDDFAKFGDALVRLGNNNATLEDKIMDVMLRIGSMGTITGFSATELLSWSTAVAATGQGAEAAGTAISKTMSDIESAVGAGGEKLEAFASVAQMTSSQFAKMWNESPSDAMQAWIEGFKQIEASGGSADATLTDLGITSVRQKQSILGLMQTVDGLNANLQMSENAWNGVTDDWGAAGDAAREAERKAEGFSGAIQLLRNNADALGVEMGESLTPFITALSDLAAMATQAYSALPDIGKYIIDIGVAAGAFGGPFLVGFNAIRNAGSDMVKSIMNGKEAFAAIAEEGMETIVSTEGLADALGITATGADGAAKKFDAMTKKEKVAAVGAKLLGGALKAIGIGASVAAVAYSISKLAEYAEYMATARNATEGFAKAVELANSGFANIDASSYVDSAQSVIESAKEMTRANSEFADELNKTWEDVNGSNALVSKYAEVIEELGGKSNLSATDQVRLKAAVDGMNDVCGTSYQVLDAVNGKLSEGTGTILENAEAWKENARQQAAYQAIQDTVAQLVDTENELAIVQAKIAEEGAALNNAEQYNLYGNADPSNLLQLLERERELIAQRDELNGSVDSYTALLGNYVEQTDAAAVSTSLYSEEVESLIEGLTALSEDNSFFNDLLADSGMTVEDLAVKMDTAGISIDTLTGKMAEYAEKTADAFNKIETVSDVSLQSMLETLEYNTETTRNWSENLTKLYAKAGDDSQRAFIDYIAGMGVEYAPIVQQLLDDNTGMLEELAAAWKEADSAGAQAAFVETQRAADEAAVKIEESATKAVSAYALLREGVDYEIENTDFKTPMAEKAAGIPEAILEQKEPVVAAVKEVEDAMVGELDGIEDRTEPYGRDFAAGHATGVINGIPVGKAAVEQYINEMLAAIPKTQDSNSPAKKTMPFGEDFVDGYAVGIEDETPEAIEAAEELVDDTLDMLATSENGAWVHGYHAAINYADGLASGTGAVKSAASGLANAVMGAFGAIDLDSVFMELEDDLAGIGDMTNELGDLIWGGVFPSIMSADYVKPMTGDVYESMKILEDAGYDLEGFIEKYNDVTEKMKGDNVSDSVKEDYEEIMALNDQLTASFEKMQEWHGLYVMKDELLTSMDSAERWSDVMAELMGRPGVAFSKEFVERVADGGDEYLSGLEKMADMTDEEVQRMVDSYDDLALAEREQKLAARALYVNSLKNLNMDDPRESMLDFWETTMDVTEALHDDGGLADAFIATGTTIEGLALDLMDLEMTMDDFVSHVKNVSSQVADGFNVMTRDNQVCLSDWTAALYHNMRESERYTENLEKVFSQVDLSIDSTAFRQAVLEGGYDSWAKIINNLANSSPEIINNAIRLYNEAIAQGQENAADQFTALGFGEEYMMQAISGIEGLTPQLSGAITSALSQGASVGNGFYPQFYGIGSSLASGIAAGIASGTGSIAAAVSAALASAIAAAKAEAEIHSPSRLWEREVGYMMGAGVAVGLDKSRARIMAASSMAMSSALDAAKHSIDINGVTAQVAAANNLAAAHRAANVVNTTNNTKTISAPMTVHVSATIREDADITKLAKEINKIQSRALRAGGYA